MSLGDNTHLHEPSPRRRLHYPAVGLGPCQQEVQAWPFGRDDAPLRAPVSLSVGEASSSTTMP